MKNLLDYYGILGISYYATTDEIKDAYRNKVKETHPDKAGGDSEQFKIIKEAYEVLSNEEKRKRYDDILFKATNFNVLSTIPKATKVNNSPTKNAEEKVRIPTAWRNILFLSLIGNLILIGLVFYINNQYQTSKKDNSLVDSRLTSVVKENQDLSKKVDSLQKYNRDLQDQVMNKNSTSITSTATPSTESSSEYVTLGSTEEQVKAILGTPQMIVGSIWSYGNNTWVSFNINNKTVTGWSNPYGTLKIK